MVAIVHQAVELETIAAPRGTAPNPSGQIDVIITREGFVDGGIELERSTEKHRPDRGQICLVCDSIGGLNTFVGEVSEHMWLQGEFLQDHSGSSLSAQAPVLENTQEDHELPRIECTDSLDEYGSPHGSLREGSESALEPRNTRSDLVETVVFEDPHQDAVQVVG